MSLMDLDKLLEISNKCIHSEPPVCTAACPVHLDVMEFTLAIEKADFKKAYKLMENKIPLARLIGRICDHPCENVCVRKDAGGSIKISELEKAVLELGVLPPKKTIPIPKKKGKVAVIGGGISGMTAAVYLDKKGYQVTVFEKSGRLGGRIWEFEGKGLEKRMIEEELGNIEKTGISINYNHEVGEDALKEYMDKFDAVYLGTGHWEQSYETDPDTFQAGNTPLFIGGNMNGNSDSVIFSASSGRRAAISIDRYIGGSSLTASREREGIFETLLDYKVGDVLPAEPVPGEKEIYSGEEAVREAERCLKCQCTECIKACSHMQQFAVTPDVYIRSINHNERIILGTHHANKMINSCTECGLCKEQCPVGIGMQDIIHATRESMVNRGKMPLSAHDFALKDMEFSNGKYFSLIRKSMYKGSGKTGYLFYPGCQLSATHWAYIGELYKHLAGIIKENEADKDVGLYLGCCGAPADWAGRQDLMQENKDKIKNVWEEMDRPVFILACSSCSGTFGKYLPEIETVSLWEILDQYGLPEGKVKQGRQVLNIHDACATRHNAGIHKSVRNIVKTLGYEIEELDYSKDRTKCCGYGGLVSYANKEQAEAFQNDRLKESSHDLLVYCAMCKDSLARENKNTYHILDLIYGLKGEGASLRKMPVLSERQNNRKKLKLSLLKEIWGEDRDMDVDKKADFKINIPDKVKAVMDERFILVSDVEEVIDHARRNKEGFFRPDTSNYLARLRKENVTYWVEYEEREGEVLVNSVYSHRMEVVEE